MRFLHGGLALEMPEDWCDQSTLLFVGKRAPPEAAAESVAIRFLLDAGEDARVILQKEIGAIRGESGGVEIVEERELACGLGVGWSATLRLSLPGGVLRQIAACVVLGRVAIVANASMGDQTASESEPRLRSVLESMTAVKPKW
jgi:hypothetical protein